MFFLWINCQLAKKCYSDFLRFFKSKLYLSRSYFLALSLTIVGLLKTLPSPSYIYLDHFFLVQQGYLSE